MKFSIAKKTILMTVIFALVLSTVAMFMFSRVIENMNDSYYSGYATDTSKTVANVIDANLFLEVKNEVDRIYKASPTHVTSEEWGSDEWNSYMAQFKEVENSESFQLLREQLRKVQDINKNNKDGSKVEIDCVYLCYVDLETTDFVYVCDGAYGDDACPPGCIDILQEVNRPLLDDPSIGFPAYITNTEEYGWLVTAGVAVYTDNDAENGKLIGYALTDISMEEVRQSQNNNILRLLIYLVIAMVVFTVIGILIIRHTIIKPVKQLSAATKEFAEKNDRGNTAVFSTLDIKTKDEIAELAESMKKMEAELNSNSAEMDSMNDRLEATQSVAQELNKLANKDSLTGVRNKTSYANRISKLDARIARGEKPEFGVLMVDMNGLKKINDSYGHNVGDAAIVRLCNIVCGVFVHSPVFRIGGDEFVAILQGEDYKNSGKLIEEINNKLDAIWKNEHLEPSERVTAAVGYSEYAPESDFGYAEVFKRADRSMYDRKREMYETMNL